jgi:hypothetical protein
MLSVLLPVQNLNKHLQLQKGQSSSVNQTRERYTLWHFSQRQNGEVIFIAMLVTLWPDYPKSAANLLGPLDPKDEDTRLLSKVGNNLPVDTA